MTAQIGLAQLPVDPSLFTNSVREATDPIHGLILDLLAHGIIADLSAAYNKLKLSVPVLDGYVINELMVFEPAPWIMKGEVANYPIFGIWRKQQVSNYFTVDIVKTTTTWGVNYILPELDMWQMGKAHALLQGVANSIRSTLYKGLHPSFMNGRQILYSYLEDVAFGSCEFKNWTAENKAGSLIQMPLLDLNFSTVELMDANDNSSALPFYETISMDLNNEENDPIEDFVVGDTRFTPGIE